MDNPSSVFRRGRGLPAGVIVRCVILTWPTSDRCHDRRRTTGTERLPASRVEVRCAGPVAGHLRVAGAHREHLPRRPALRSRGRNRAAPGSCWRRVPVPAARELPANGLRAVPTPRPPVAPHLRADPPGMSARHGAGLRRDQSLDLVRTPPPEPARQPAQRVRRGARPVAGEPKVVVLPVAQPASECVVFDHHRVGSGGGLGESDLDG